MTKILISGASIAGPALACFLRDRGLDITVIERAPTLRDGGYAVDIRGAALDAITRAGLRDALAPFETDTQSNAMVDRAGRVFGRTQRGLGVIDEGDIEIHRGDLSRVLYDASRRHASYRFGDWIAALHESEDGVTVELASGHVATYDLVVGADGVHSRTRALAFGPEHELVRPLGACMAIFTVPNHLGLVREQWLWSAPGRVASVKSANGDRDLKVCVFFAVPRDTVVPDEVEDQRALVASAFAESGWEFPRFMEAMKSAEDFYCDLTCQVHMDRFARDRIALVGDAAHCPSPMAGQGTSLAIVGAYVLAAELSASGDPRVALERYDATMRPFVLRNLPVAEKLAKGFMPHTRFEAWMRDLVMRMMAYLPSEWLANVMMGDIREASKAITLPAFPDLSAPIELAHASP